ncbi:replication protein A 70 kDa DNA-binding subunit B [Artemisia annua]|uniref:Replication protein A 70 kDa DNA-binding subunit B n=1 Tax=Artemisia annua TaxID=35608 RepID=A0A2U1L4I4_ARTAN|nr:replication protein A 70 kDa DNA-binding subunit B [Artemisia annua]
MGEMGQFGETQKNHIWVKWDNLVKLKGRSISDIKNITSVIVGTIIAIQEEEGWWYLGCRKCSKKVVKDSEFVDLDDDSKGKMSVTSDQWRCTKCNEIVKGIKSIFRLQVRVQDESGTMSLSLFNDEEAEATSSKCVGISALDLESQTDETVTPTNVLKSTATSPPAKTSSGKRPSDDGPSTACSKTKRQIVDIKMEKNA